ncbi:MULTISPECIES: cation transporter [unclassified Corynebacterium]|uniref:cation transporter n=1 Tax=unclassified Corynebacterium TaxID=2624378 RepID=UPI0029C9FB52|nr:MULTISPECIES: cation transporter [unclassified Corynebacterium]WPF66945.1 cation transporter [Corynebacterium sp. 22KM0430]WPF69433.1 cation transporter [Corynebacterium sp. 21KM1197]
MTSSSSLDTKARRTVAVVAGLNGAGFLLEMTMAFLIGSAALFADAADFLEDFLINVLVLSALGWAVSRRRKASYLLAGLILIPGIAGFATAGWKIFSGEPPEPAALSLTALAAAAINVICALLLTRLRGARSALVRGAWLAARNDVAANVLIVLAGLLTAWWWSVWPDVIAGVVIGLINLSAAKEVFEQARAEDPELED